MPQSELIVNHYTRGSLLAAIGQGLAKLGKSPGDATVEDLGPVDEFHIGGRAATERLLDQLAIANHHQVLDVGCGLGGASRFAAQRYGCRVTGIDITPEYVETGGELCAWVGLAEYVDLRQGDATALPWTDARFHRAYMIHVGMNIVDKFRLAQELYRVLHSGAKLGIYDVMATGDGELAFPVPWATTPEGSAVASPQTYRQALETAGFRLVAEENRREFALEFFARQRARLARAGEPSPLGIHLLMGATTPAKIDNILTNIAQQRLAPVELIAEKPG
ncbi:MAG: class I SAM-dependent methyltransferase [Candidatus Competibacterales bacterium]